MSVIHLLMRLVFELSFLWEGQLDCLLPIDVIRQVLNPMLGLYKSQS